MIFLIIFFDSNLSTETLFTELAQIKVPTLQLYYIFVIKSRFYVN